MKVAVLMGSKSDWPVLSKAVKTLQELSIQYVVRVLSAHRTPKALDEFLENEFFDVCIAAAGGAAHLAGAVAARTLQPVIGVPVGNTLQGFDALLSTVQMPPGVPVATVGVDNGTNAALLAAQMGGIHDDELRDRIYEYRLKRADKVMEDNAEVSELVANL